MADDGEHSPVWARSKRRSGGNPLVGIIVTLLALFGVLTAVLGIKEQSLAEGGAITVAAIFLIGFLELFNVIGDVPLKLFTVHIVDKGKPLYDYAH